MQKAKELLKTTSLSVKEVSARIRCLTVSILSSLIHRRIRSPGFAGSIMFSSKRLKATYHPSELVFTQIEKQNRHEREELIPEDENVRNSSAVARAKET